MPRLEGAVTHMPQNSNSFEVLFGAVLEVDAAKPRKIFDPLVVEFLENLSELILSSGESRAYGDLVTFAYWCRTANLKRLKAKYESTDLRVGRGKTFHIAPANVPINFAFSLAFSMLSGNSNIVRLPSKDFPQVTLFIKYLNSLKNNGRFAKLLSENCLVRYGHQTELTEFFSQGASCRIIWGGDRTVTTIRSIASEPRTIDISFVDRYSFSVIDAKELATLNEVEFLKLVEKFYTDSYLFDQNACSSPRILVWVGAEPSNSTAINAFWESLNEISKSKYGLEPVQAIEKLTKVCLASISSNEASRLRSESNYSYILRLSESPNRILDESLNMGTFLEVEVSTLSEVAEFVSEKFQTMTYFGFSNQDLRAFIESSQLAGIDRVVPIGSALDMDLIWDGYDLPLSLSRIVDIR